MFRLRRQGSSPKAGSLHTKLIEQIRSGSFVESELVNLYNNASQRHFPEVMEAVEEQMRARFSRTANKLFGKKK